MDEQEIAQQKLTAMFRRDRAEAEAHPPRKPRWQLGPLTLPWIFAIALVIFIISPTAFFVIYPRFGPVDTMTAFCLAESNGEYATAYALLSKHAQQHESLDIFTKASRNNILVTCSASGGIPIIFGGTQASLDVQYVTLGSNVEFDGSMSFVREQAGWRVDSMSPDLFDLAT